MKAIIIGGSAGSIPIVRKLLLELGHSICPPIIICLHRKKNVPDRMCEIFGSCTNKTVIEPDDKCQIINNTIYLAPSNYHLLIESDFTFSLSTEEMINFSRPAIDLSFQSAAKAFKSDITGILLTGANKDGAKGLFAIKLLGGQTIVQEPAECSVPTMPLAAMELKCVDKILDSNGIARYINTLTI